MVTIENKTKKVNYKPTLGELIEHDNGKVGMITHVTFNDEVKVCVFQELYKNHTDTEARWAIKNVKPFTGKITIQNT